jgi:hypothetical protein
VVQIILKSPTHYQIKKLNYKKKKKKKKKKKTDVTQASQERGS